MTRMGTNSRYTRMLETLTPSQKEAVVSPDNVVLRAAAGSGKTTVLVARFIESFRTELERESDRSVAENLSSVVGITFTEKAAAEMKDRIRSLLIDWLQTGPARAQLAGAWRQARDAMAQCNIGTIHSFCASVLRRFPLEAGLDPEFVILDETESYLMRREAVESLFLDRGQAENRAEPDSPFAVYPRHKAIQLILPLVEQFETLRSHLALYAEAPEERLVQGVQELLNRSGQKSAPDKRNPVTYDLLLEAARLKLLAQGALLAHSTYTTRKQKLSLLDFEDLQTLLLRLLAHPDGAILDRLRAEFATIMIDEFQDTDRFQWELARMLSSTADGVIRAGKLFVVGDEMQSIYAFRGANLKAFSDTTAEIEGCGGARVQMRENFRSLPNIIGFINLVFADDSETQDLPSASMLARRTPEPPDHTGTVELLFPKPEGLRKDNVRVEAELLARRIAAMVEGNSALNKAIFDETTRELRPCRYDDIALLIHRRTHLGTYQDALRRSGIPFLISGGLGFYERQEIKDISCLLEVLLDPRDDIALVGLLRSPFFSVSDEALFWLSAVPGRAEGDGRLWERLRSLAQRGAASVAPWDAPALDELDEEALPLAYDLIREASRRAATGGPGAVIRFMLSRTGALAAYAAGPDGAQCVANLEKIDDILSAWDRRGYRSPGPVIRLLERLSTEGVREAEARPDLEAGEGVKIMTIHVAKGLEFPIVIVVDVFAKPHWGGSEPVYIDPEFGLGLRVPDAAAWGNQVNTQLRDAIKPRLKKAASDEQRRLWYVACTRARDHLLLSGTAENKPNRSLGSRVLKLLDVTSDSVGREATRVQIESLDSPVALFSCKEQIPREAIAGAGPRGTIERLHAAASALGPGTTNRPRPVEPQLRFVLRCSPVDFAPEVSPSDLDSYWSCPRRYLLDRILSPVLTTDEAPLVGDSQQDETQGAEFGTLVHEVFQQLDVADDTEDVRILASLAETPEDSAVRDVLRGFLSTFRASRLAEALRAARRVRREVPFVLRREAGILRGKIDLLYEDKSGHMCVVDYKTDRDSTGIVERYKAQMAAYALAVSSLYALPPDGVSVSIYLARTGQLLPLSIDADASVWVTSLMDEICAALECAHERPCFDCFEERPAACKDCYPATELACLRFRGALASE